MEAIERICLCGMLVSTFLLWFIQYVNNSLAKRMTLMEDKILVLEKRRQNIRIK